MPELSRCSPTWRALFALLTLARPLAAADGDVLTSGVTAFDLGGGLSDSAKAVAVQPDGKIVLVGTVAMGGGAWGLGVARFLPNGNLDLTFSGDGKVVDPFGSGLGVQTPAGSGVAVLDDGRILIAGTVDMNGDRNFLVGRLLADGQADLAFGTGPLPGATMIPFNILGNVAADDLAAMAVDRSGRIVVVGSADVTALDNRDFAVARLTAAGALDTSFSGDGKTTMAIDPTDLYTDTARSVAIDRLGRIIVAGSTKTADGTGFDFGVVRLLADGSPDASFGSNGRLALGFDFGSTFDDHAYAVAVQPDGRIVVAGRAGFPTAAAWIWVVARLTENSTPQPLDLSFAFGAGYVIGDFACGAGNTACADRDAIYALALQGDGKMVLTGQGNGLHAPSPDNLDFGATRLLASGLQDVSFGDDNDGAMTFDFNRGPGGHSDGGSAVTIAPDGRLVMAGYAEWDSLDTDFAWVRLDNAYIFADGFEWGSTFKWSATAP